jgi:predicted HTH transcriptional regulator
MSTIDPMKLILQHVKRIGKITNRDCRQLLDASYDQSVFLLGRMCRVGLLVRKGTSSATHYILSEVKVPATVLDELRAELRKRML